MSHAAMERRIIRALDQDDRGERGSELRAVLRRVAMARINGESVRAEDAERVRALS